MPNSKTMYLDNLGEDWREVAHWCQASWCWFQASTRDSVVGIQDEARSMPDILLLCSECMFFFVIWDAIWHTAMASLSVCLSGVRIIHELCKNGDSDHTTNYLEIWRGVHITLRLPSSGTQNKIFFRGNFVYLNFCLHFLLVPASFSGLNTWVWLTC